MAKKILIVDDEADVLIALEKRLLDAGYLVFKADNGPAAIRLAKRKKPDLILLDVMMPGMDGSQTAQLLKNDAATAEIPILFLTCLITPQEQGSGHKESGGNFFIAKPYEPQALIAEIGKYIT